MAVRSKGREDRRGERWMDIKAGAVWQGIVSSRLDLVDRVCLM